MVLTVNYIDSELIEMCTINMTNPQRMPGTRIDHNDYNIVAHWKCYRIGGWGRAGLGWAWQQLSKMRLR